MKKKLCTIILVLLLALTVTACGKSESDKNNNSGSPDKNSSVSSDNESSDTKVTEDTSDNEPAASGSFADISAMNYDEAVAYLDSLPETDASYFEITTDEMADGEAAIARYRGSDEVVIIPETIDGLTITQVNKWSFTNHDDIVAVKAPKTLRVIEEGAFENTFNLIYVTGLENVEKIGHAAFNNSPKLRVLYFTDSVNEVKGYVAIYGQDEITVKVPKGSYIANYIKDAGINDGMTLEEY